MYDLTEKQKENEGWFEDHLEDFLKNLEYKGKYLVIHNREVKKAFEYEHHAIEFAAREFKSFDECIIREVIDEREIVNFVNVQFGPINYENK